VSPHLWTDALADYLVGLIQDHLGESLSLSRVAKVRPDELAPIAFSDPLEDALPAVYVILGDPRILPARIIGPVVDVEERFRLIFLKRGPIDQADTAALNADIQALTALLRDHPWVEPEVLPAPTQQLLPLVMDGVEYDPPELRPLRKLDAALTGCALPVRIVTTTA